MSSHPLRSKPADPVSQAQSQTGLYALDLRQPQSLPSLLPGPFLVLMAVSFLVIVPFFFLGNPSGHDFEFHMFSWMEVVSQCKQGILYPRWAALSHWGYGEARFLFYPPLSWNLGALLGSFLPWVAVSGAYVWIALSAAGSSMFVLARRWLSRSDASFAAALYAANPYHLVVIYWRSALAELLASALLPLLLLCILDFADRPARRTLVALSFIIAAAWLTNAPAAVMVNYSVAVLAVVVAVVRRQPRVLMLTGVSVLLGALLSCFYQVPAAYQQHGVNLGEVFALGVRPQDNFLFTILKDADHNRFNWLISIVGAAEFVVLAGAAILSTRLRRTQRVLWWPLVIWAGCAALLTLPFTMGLWEHLPKLRFVQLPWRWLLCLNVAFALLLTAAFHRWWMRVAIYCTMLLMLGLLWYRVQPPWWDNAADIREMHDAILDRTGYEGTDEYVPTGVDPYEINKNAPQVLLEGSGETAKLQVSRWQAESRRFTVVGDSSMRARLRLFNYPAWKVTVNGTPVQAETVETTGELAVPLAPGTNQVAVEFERTWDRLAGALISLATFVFIVLGFFYTARRHNRHQSVA